MNERIDKAADCSACGARIEHLVGVIESYQYWRHPNEHAEGVTPHLAVPNPATVVYLESV